MESEINEQSAQLMAAHGHSYALPHFRVGIEGGRGKGVGHRPHTGLWFELAHSAAGAAAWFYRPENAFKGDCNN